MRRAFSLTEFLVVIGIILVLAAIMFPALISARREADKTSCLSNLHQAYLALAMHKELNDSDGDPARHPWDCKGPLVAAGVIPNSIVVIGKVDDPEGTIILIDMAHNPVDVVGKHSRYLGIGVMSSGSAVRHTGYADDWNDARSQSWWHN